MSIEPTALSAVQAAELIAQGQLSAEDLTRACLARIDEREPVVQAWTFLDQEYALKQARAADQARREGKPLGPLHGVPVAIKDI
ncbi:MAG: amidase, partial [Candidatus Competibacteraceae bacterium]|nr:amidase [Candidatus Competibacteraceae bacterium]